jgi:hypothetical protein
MDLNVLEESEYDRACREIEEAEDDEYEAWLEENRDTVCLNDGEPRICPIKDEGGVSHCFVVEMSFNVFCCRMKVGTYSSGQNLSLRNLILRKRVKDYVNQEFCVYRADMKCGSVIVDEHRKRHCFLFSKCGHSGQVCGSVCFTSRKSARKNGAIDVVEVLRHKGLLRDFAGVRFE